MNCKELDVFLSQINKKPIRTIDDLTKEYYKDYGPSKLKNNIKKILDCKGKGKGITISRDELENIQVNLGKLYDILVSFGGIGISSHRGGYFEEDLEQLLFRGQLWIAHGVERKKGEESQCHRNSVYLWDANKDRNVYLATGYALMEDGLWIQHSWCLHKKPRSVSVIETTSPKRIAYFGYAMLPDEAIRFYFDNE